MSYLRLCASTTKCLAKKGLLVESAFTEGMNRQVRFDLKRRASTYEYKGCLRTVSGAAKDNEPLRKAKTPQGRFDMNEEKSNKDVLEKFPEDVNPDTKEKGGPRGPEPTRYGDWERKGRCIDF